MSKIKGALYCKHDTWQYAAIQGHCRLITAEHLFPSLDLPFHGRKATGRPYHWKGANASIDTIKACRSIRDAMPMSKADGSSLAHVELAKSRISRDPAGDSRAQPQETLGALDRVPVSEALVLVPRYTITFLVSQSPKIRRTSLGPEGSTAGRPWRLERCIRPVLRTMGVTERG